jgi:hypothetical protein
MPHKGLPSLLERHWAESALAIGAVVIAAVSLWVAYDTEATNRQLVVSERQLVTENAWPFVQESYSTAMLKEHSLTPVRLERVIVANAGVGPAKVETFEILWQGRAYPSWPALARACCGYDGPTDTSDPMDTSSIAGSVLRPGQAVPILYYPWTPANSVIWRKLHNIVPTVGFKVCYCSVFDQCWLTNGEGLHPRSASVCPASRVPYTG